MISLSIMVQNDIIEHHNFYSRHRCKTKISLYLRINMKEEYIFKIL